MHDANLTYLTACLYSIRFWQYFFIDMLCSVLYFDSYIIIHDTIELKSSYHHILKALTCIVSGYIYSMFGYKRIMMVLTLILCFLSFFILKLKDKTQEKDHVLTWQDNMAYFIFIIAEETSLVISATAVPRTFGIRFGASVYCLVLSSRIVTLIVAKFSLNITVMFVTGLCANIAALIICFFFKEELDIGRLVERGLITFRNFGLQKT